MFEEVSEVAAAGVTDGKVIKPKERTTLFCLLLGVGLYQQGRVVCLTENLQFIPNFCNAVKCDILVNYFQRRKLVIVWTRFLKPKASLLGGLTQSSNWFWSHRKSFSYFYQPHKPELKVRASLRINQTYLYQEFLWRLFECWYSCWRWTARFFIPARSNWRTPYPPFSNVKRVYSLTPCNA